MTTQPQGNKVGLGSLQALDTSTCRKAIVCVYRATDKAATQQIHSAGAADHQNKHAPLYMSYSIRLAAPPSQLQPVPAPVFSLLP